MKLLLIPMMALSAVSLMAPAALAQLPAPKTVDPVGGLHAIHGQGGIIGVLAGPDGVFVIDDQYPDSVGGTQAGFTADDAYVTVIYNELKK